eukprot:854428-Prymnesium_polylepis.1
MVGRALVRGADENRDQEPDADDQSEEHPKDSEIGVDQQEPPGQYVPLVERRDLPPVECAARGSGASPGRSAERAKCHGSSCSGPTACSHDAGMRCSAAGARMRSRRASSSGTGTAASHTSPLYRWATSRPGAT